MQSKLARDHHTVHSGGVIQAPWTVLADETLTAAQKLILTLIYERQVPFGYTTCTNRILGIVASLSDESVRLNLGTLVGEGRVERAFKDNKRRLRINPEYEWPCPYWTCDPMYDQHHDFRAFT